MSSVKVVHDKESGLNIDEANLSDYVGKPVFSSEKMYPTTPVSIHIFKILKRL